MNLISHICWLLILHLPLYAPASNHAESSFRFGPDYEYKYGTVPKRKVNRIYHLRGSYADPPIWKPKVNGSLFDYHPGHLVTSTTPRPPKLPPGYNNNIKPNEYDSNDSLDHTTHLQHHVPQSNTEEGYPEEYPVGPKKSQKDNNLLQLDTEEEYPEEDPVAPVKSQQDNDLLQINPEEEYPESFTVATTKSKKKPRRPIKSKPNTKSTTRPHAQYKTTPKRKWRPSQKLKTAKKTKNHGKTTTEPRPEDTTQTTPTTRATRKRKQWWEKIEEIVNSWLEE